MLSASRSPNTTSRKGLLGKAKKHQNHQKVSKPAQFSIFHLAKKANPKPIPLDKRRLRSVIWSLAGACNPKKPPVFYCFRASSQGLRNWFTITTTTALPQKDHLLPPLEESASSDIILEPQTLRRGGPRWRGESEREFKRKTL